MDKAKDFEKGLEEYKAKRKQEIEEMAKVLCINDNFVCETCPSENECFNYKHAKQLYDAGYSKIPENAVVLTREEYQMLNYFNHRGEELLKQERKETAEKFARLVEFHSVSTMQDGIEYFTISALGLKEILHEEFGIPYYETCEEITEKGVQNGN